MNHKRMMAIVALSSLVLVSCDQGTAPPESPGSSLVGSWSWIRSAGGIAGGLRTPPPAVRLAFGDDGSVAYYEDGLLKAQTSYTLGRELSPFASDTLDVIRYASLDRFQTQAFSVSGDSLMLTDLCIDCFGHLYVRSR